MMFLLNKSLSQSLNLFIKPIPFQLQIKVKESQIKVAHNFKLIINKMRNSPCLVFTHLFNHLITLFVKWLTEDCNSK